jgi:hypothetical protein
MVVKYAMNQGHCIHFEDTMAVIHKAINIGLHENSNTQAYLINLPPQTTVHMLKTQGKHSKLLQPTGLCTSHSIPEVVNCGL